jgi:hypothetical protein
LTAPLEGSAKVVEVVILPLALLLVVVVLCAAAKAALVFFTVKVRHVEEAKYQ